MYYNSYYYFDWTYLLVIAGLIITFFAQIKMRTTYEKYKDVQASCGMTGAEAALTYVAAAASGLLQLLRIVLLFGKRNRR